jgi:glyoxylase-like metal-dependent hydrolase (beta-lactamase superfamily II)
VRELANGIRRLTFPLPLGIDHVHCYLLPSADGGWTLVDTGLGQPGAEERWAPILAKLGGSLERIVVTHFHPDHVGDAGPLAALSGATVFQNPLDYEQCLSVWGERRSRERYAQHAVTHGMPALEVEDLRRETDALAQLVHAAADPAPLEPGDELDGWEVVGLPGHADGHLALHRDGVLLAGDALLSHISPTVGLYPESRPDPLGDFMASLQRIVELAPSIAYAGHQDPLADPPGRARELVEHHRIRLDATAATLADAPKSGYEVSLTLFDADLSPTLRRFALAESLAHLERLVREGRAKRYADEGGVFYRGR